jgi:hypothetical protein
MEKSTEGEPSKKKAKTETRQTTLNDFGGKDGFRRVKKDEDIQEDDNEGELAQGELEAHEVVEEEEEQEEEVPDEGTTNSRSRSGRRLNRSWRLEEEGY